MKKEDGTTVKTFAGFTAEEFKMVQVNIAPKEATVDQIKMFLMLCNRKGLDPFQKQVYLIPRKDKQGNMNLIVQASIDGYRAIAARTGVYAGSDDVIFDNELRPTKATITVYRIVSGIRCPFTASARLQEYKPGGTMGFMWDKMPCAMLGFAAERLALRKGFPEALSGIDDDAFLDSPVVEVQKQEPKQEVLTPEVIETKEYQEELIEILIGKGGMFEKNIPAAKKWIEEKSGKTFDKLTAEDAMELIGGAREEMDSINDFASAQST